nr:hypothetical protein [Tanacetum cinerariifolium]
MAKRDEMAMKKLSSKVDSSSNQVADVDDVILVESYVILVESSMILVESYMIVGGKSDPKPSPNTKFSVRRLPKEVAKEKGHVKLKVTRVESNVGKRKRLVKDKEVEDERDSDVDGSDGESDSDKEKKVSEEADVSRGKGEKTKVFKCKEKVVVSMFKKRNEEVKEERDSDVKGSDGESDSDKEHKGSKEADLSNESEDGEVEADIKGNESEKDNESEEDKETEVSKKSDDSDPGVKDVKMKGVKGNKTVVVSKAKKRKHVSDSSSEEEKVSKPKKVSKKKKQVKDVKKRKHVSDSSSSYDESSSLEEEKRFTRFVVRSFSASSYKFKLEKGIICVTPDKVHEILGVPLGGTFVFDLLERPLDDPFVMEWFKQFDPNTLKEIHACDIAEKLVLTKTVDFMLSQLSYVICKRDGSEPKTLGGFYIGPLCFLIELEIQEQVIGRLDLHRAWTESEFDQTEGFYDVGVGNNVSWTRKSSVLATNKKGFCSMIEEKISMISAEKIALEDLFKRANVEFPNDGKVIELYEKYRRLFKESVFVEDFQVYIDDFVNNDDDGGGKNENHGSEEADLSNESEEEGKGVKTKVFKGKEKVVVSKFKKQDEEVEADIKGNEREKDNEKEDKETEVSKEKDDSEPGVKDLKMKGVKGNKTVVVSKAKKRKPVSDSSSEEEKVSKPKKVSKKKKQVKDVKKRKHVSDSSSSYDESSSSEDEKVSKPKKVSKKKKQVKDLKKKQQFARFVVRSYSASSYEFKLEKGIIYVTPDKVHQILGVPLGGTFVFDLLERPLDDLFVKEWFKQFDPNILKEIRACDIAKKLVLIKTVDFMFKVNFLMLFANVMGNDWCGFIHKFLQDSSEPKTLGGFYIGPLCFLIEQVIGRLDLHGEWTESELDQTEGFYDVGVGNNMSWTRKPSMLATDKKKIALEDLFKRANAEFPNDGKVIKLYEKYRRLFKESVFVEDFQVYIDDFNNNDDDGGGKNDNHGFDNVGKKKDSSGKDVVNDKKDGVNAEKDGVNVVQEGEANVNEEPEHMLEEETFMQWIEKNIDWVGEVIDCLYDAYYEPISVVCPQTPQRVVTHLSPNKRIVKPSIYLKSPYMNKRIKVTSIIKRLEFVLGNSLFAILGDKYETIFETRSGHDLSSVRLNMETLAPKLWIDANVIDCWVAILNHDELVRGCPSPRRHFFPTGCIIKAIIEGTIDEEQQWKVFSDEILAQFKHDVSSISFFEVDLAFFSICSSGHFFVVVFHLKSPSAMIILDNSNCGETYNSKYKAVCEPLKSFLLGILKTTIIRNIFLRIPKLKWSITNNHSDCEVFTMIHLEHYFGNPIGQWDFEKMFDLAFKFESENDEQTRISIIVNAIKNRNESDPAKTKTFVENQKDVTLKNK